MRWTCRDGPSSVPVATVRLMIASTISLVTLGVGDVTRSTAFYQALGWPLSSASQPGVVSFFRTTGGLLGLFGTSDLAADAGADAVGPTPQFRGVTLAINVGSREDVDAAIESARDAGARIGKEPQATEWGGYHGYFADPDGHLWEVAHNPFWPLADGLPQLP